MRRNWIGPSLLTIALVVVMVGCARAAGVQAQQLRPGVRTTMSNAQPGAKPTPGLIIRLGEGTGQEVGQAQALPIPAPAAASSLGEAEVQAILARLPAIAAQTGDEQVFSRPASSLPAPRPGKTVTETFPPPPQPPAAVQPPASTLSVVRRSPEGPVPLAPYLSVTFNQPMVALTGLEDLAAAAVPAQLKPTVAGRWRWVGTQTLFFEPVAATQGATSIPDRLPMATTYTVTVPAGIASASGARLAEAVQWTFSTPPPQLASYYPNGGPERLDPLLFASFDQAIDPQAVLRSIQVRSGSHTYPLRLAKASEVEADEAVSHLSSVAPAGRWLAFVATEPFPPDATVTVTILKGASSAEGPRRTEEDQVYSFRTYGPLRLTEKRCGWDNECRPLMDWMLRFSNPLDATVFDESWIAIDPPLPGARIDVMGDTVAVRGLTKGRTGYRVTIKGDLQDVYGQVLGRDLTVRFDVGSSEPALAGNGRNLVVLDPSARPAFSVYSINVPRLKVQVQAVTPTDWDAYGQYRRDFYRTDNPPALPGRTVINQTVQVKSQPDELTETSIDLAPALPGGLGQAIVVIRPDPPIKDRPDVAIHAWVQSTRIGLDAAADHEQMVAWANSLGDGSPLAGVELSLLPGRSAVVGSTGPDGTASLTLPDGPAARLLVARQGNDLAILPRNEYPWGDPNDGWQRRSLGDELRWYVFDDRQMYRPGEEVHLKGWVRRVGMGKAGDVGAPGGARQVSYVLMDPRGNRLLDGTAAINVLGGFDFALTVPKETNLGQVMLQLSADVPDASAREFVHTFQVQEFRRPEFEVTAKASEGPHLVGGSATTTVQASYYAGGGLPNADVTWRVRSSAGSYTPPNWSDWTFGIWQPWWVSFDSKPYYGMAGQSEQVYTGRTDAQGAHNLKIDFVSVDPPRPMNVSAEATVMDVNRQAWTAAAEMLVHPAQLYVGLRTDRMFVQQGDPLRVDAIVVDLDGNVVRGIKIDVKAARLEWRYKNDAWQEVEEVTQPCTLTSAKEPGQCTFETPEGGTYRISATIEDSEGRRNLTQMDRWVSGGSRPPSREVEQEEVTLIPDRKEYRPGDTAEILLQAPFYPAEGVLTLRRSGIVATQRISMTGPTYIARVPVDEEYIPNIYVQVDLVGTAPRLTDSGEPDQRLPRRPAYATGQLNLLVPPLQRELSVSATPREKALEPGGKTTVDLEVRDAAGKPVPGAELAVVVVDEAVLSLTGYRLGDPLDVFYALRSTGADDWHLRQQIVLANPADLLTQASEGAADMMQSTKSAQREMLEAPAGAAMATAAPAAAPSPQMDRGAAPANGPAIALRTDFNALATFAPAVPTDAQGRAQVEVKLPDNLTRYRVMVVAVAGARQFGSGESAITARLPLMVRPSAPRFLNFGDRFELPVVLQNQTERPMTVTVAARATNAVLIRSDAARVSSAGFSVSVPANDRVEVRFPATTMRPGMARFQFGAVAQSSGTSAAPADAAEVALQVWTPATTEAFATYGVLDEGAIAQPVIAPSNVYTQFGGLEVTTSSTALQALTDAVLYLTSYPFECAEQLSSRVLAVASLRDVLTAFQAEGLPAPEEMQSAVVRDVNRLLAMQNPDGGWPIWRRGYDSWPYVSVYVAHALQVARDKGFDVSDEGLQRAQPYLAQIEQHIPAWYGARARRSIVAYALYVRSLTGDRDTARARQLTDEILRTETKSGMEASPEALGWLLGVLTGDSGSRRQVDAIRLYLANHVSETAGAANFVSSYGDDNYLLMASDRRADGVILSALIADQPKSDLIPKIVNGLLAHRKAGRWGNTQENTFILLALDRYFNTYEAQTPDFVARLWLGDQYAGDHAFQGRTTERSQIDVPMAYLAAGGAPQNLVLSKDGPGRLYYRLGLRYAPTDLNLAPLDAGFTVERSYEPIDNRDDVRRLSDGTWEVKAGARVRVRVTLVAPSRRYHVALVDPLPAGFEAVNPSLAVSGDLPADTGPEAASEPARAAGAAVKSGPPVWSWWRWWNWYEHQNLRDDRAEAFTSLLWEGVYNYTYVARATTPGTFVVPPAKAEEMYAPETFGRSGTMRVVIK